MRKAEARLKAQIDALLERGAAVDAAEEKRAASWISRRRSRGASSAWR